MALTGKQKNYVRGLAHHKQVAVTVGNAGLSETVIKEVKQTLLSHELVKIKLPAASSEQKKQLLTSLCDQSGAEVVQLVGRVGVIYKAADPARIELQ